MSISALRGDLWKPTKRQKHSQTFSHSCLTRLRTAGQCALLHPETTGHHGFDSHSGGRGVETTSSSLECKEKMRLTRIFVLYQSIAEFLAFLLGLQIFLHIKKRLGIALLKPTVGVCLLCVSQCSRGLSVCHAMTREDPPRLIFVRVVADRWSALLQSTRCAAITGQLAVARARFAPR